MLCLFSQQFLEKLPIYVAIGIVSLGVLIVFAILLVEEITHARFYKQLREKSNSVRVYKIDFIKEEVTYFNITSPQFVYHTALGAFYNSFPANQHKALRDWINAILENDEEKTDMLEIDMYDAKLRKQYFSLLQVDAYTPEEKVLHLSSYFLKYMEVNKNSKDSAHGMVNYRHLVDIINNSNKKRGYTIVYRFIFKRVQDQDKEMDPFMMNQLKNSLYPYTNSHAFMAELSGNEICLTDVGILGREKGLRLCRSGLNSVRQYLALNGHLSKVDVYCGIVPNYSFPGEGEKIIQCAQESALYGSNIKKSISWYEQHYEEISHMQDFTYKSEIQRVINEKKLVYLYRPIFNVDFKEVIGYFLKVNLEDSLFTDIDSFKDSAIRIGEDKDVYSTIIRETIPLYVNSRETPDQCLFLPIRNEERSYMLTKLSHLQSSKEANIVFVYSEENTLGFIDAHNIENFISDLKSIKSKGYKIALWLQEGDRSLPNEVYAEYDYFICSFAKPKEGTSSNTAIRSKLHSLVEKLLKFGKPIIANDIDDWGALELIVRSGLRYISSDVFAKYSEEIKPVSTKSIRRVKEFSNKY